MRFLVMGAGAVGGVIAARLFQAGYDVTAVARGPHLSAMKEQGLRLETPDQVATVAVPAIADPGEYAWSSDDVVLLAVKSQDSPAALSRLAAVAPPSSLIVCAQNGVANERMALRHFASVAGMCVMCPTSHLEPGVVQAHSSPVTGLLDVGTYPTGVDERVTAVGAALSTATFQSVPRPDIMRWKHTKLLMNLGNAVEALLGHGSHRSELVAMARKEAEACFGAAGIEYVTQQEDEARRAGLLTMAPIAGRPRGGGSSWQSLQRGSGAIEADYLNGEVVLLGRLHSVPTPVNAMLQRVANEAARNDRQPGSYDEDELIRQIG